LIHFIQVSAQAGRLHQQEAPAMTFSKFDFDVITDPGLQRERVPWIPLRRPQPGSDTANNPEQDVNAGETKPASA
jgi:hypothetical protein